MSRDAILAELIRGQARQLKMPGLARAFETLARKAKEDRAGHEEYLNYVAIDLPPKPSGEVWFIDCFHETIGEPGNNKIIAVSFTEFLDRALLGSRIHYWLEPDFGGYGDALERSS
jgi:hypothetical protein